ncbi:MAG: HyaD/HybD family hydrogenase maturation endopeptidase [Polyangiaceae bacterium]|nr:HyaD/HybD family hydrogenase maturation endopeptidase [Polyangiaceae bacterium]
MKSRQMENSLLILGIGNILWADEGFGVRCVEALDAGWQFGDEVKLMDGGTQGLYLLPYIEDARRLIVFDAVDYGKRPGEMVIARNDEVPRFMGVKKMSLHQTGFQEVLACAALGGKLPESMTLIGVQPEQLEDYGGSLCDVVKARIPDALKVALECVARWGIACSLRTSPAGAHIGSGVLGMDSYEAGRPSAEQACRYGDDRFLDRFRFDAISSLESGQVIPAEQ